MSAKASPPPSHGAPRSPLAALSRLDANHRQWIALPLAILAVLISPTEALPLNRFLDAWDIYAIVLLLLAWGAILTGNPAHAQRTARLQDSGRAAILGFVLVGACASLLAVILTLHAQKTADPHRSLHLGQTFVTVLASWVLVHTLFTLHYAHVYYRSASRKPPVKALDIPGEDIPDYLDFAYFSFVIGATAQTADIGITSPEMRRLALLHGILSFFFNTIILALSINMLASLL